MALLVLNRNRECWRDIADEPISAEAVEFSPAPAQVRNEQTGRKTKSRATGCWKHRSWECSRDVECSPGRHACQQAENAFGPYDWLTYGGCN